MRSLALAAALLGLAALPGAQAVLAEPIIQWKELGPAPIDNGSFAGRISALVCSPTDADLYYAGGADSGVWRTGDGGLTWRNLTGSLKSTPSGALALDPQNENVLYVGTGEANYANHSRYGLGLFKTTDGGETWQALGESTFGGRCFSRIVVDPSASQTVYAAVTRAGGFPELAAAKGHPDAAGPVGVFKSTDGGTSWTQLGGGLPNLSATDLSIDPTLPSTLYAGIGRIFGDPSNGIYKTTNGGSTWTKLAGGLPAAASTGRVSVRVAPSQPNRLYAMVTLPTTSTGGGAFTQGTYRSDDNGSTWSTLPLTNIQSSFGWYLSVVEVHPTDPDFVVFGGVTLFRTLDGGTSFTNITPPHVDQHAACWDASGRLLAGDDGGVHRSDDSGLSWSSLNEGLGTIQFYAGLSSHPSDDELFLGGTQDNGTNRRDANNLGWTQVFGGDGGWTQIDQAAPNRLFVEFQGTGNLFLSTNGGTSFSFSSTGINSGDRNAFLPPFLIDPTNSSRMLYGTHRIYSSANGGSSWVASSSDLTTGTGAIRSLAMAASDTDVVWVATNDGHVQVSSDGGSTFQLVLSGQPGWPRVTRELFVHPDDEDTAFLAVASFGVDQILRTVDRGLSFTPLDGDLPDIPVNVLAVRPAQAGRPEELFAGTDAGLYHSRNDGTTWRPYGRGLPNAPVIDILLEPARDRIVAATQGRGAWRASLSRAAAIPKLTPTPK